MKLAMVLLAVIAGVAIGHAMFSFYWLTFDPSQWSKDGRFWALMIYSLFGGAGAIITIEMEK